MIIALTVTLWFVLAVDVFFYVWVYLPVKRELRNICLDLRDKQKNAVPYWKQQS